MDYFTQLLESYKKLKKRTFKLSYLTEQEQTGAAAEASKKGYSFNPGQVGPHQGYYVDAQKNIFVPNEAKTALIPWEGEGGGQEQAQQAGKSTEEFPMPAHLEGPAGPQEIELSEKYSNSEIPRRLKRLEVKFNLLCQEIILGKRRRAGAAEPNLTLANSEKCNEKAYQQVYTRQIGGLASLFEGRNVNIQGEDINILKESPPALVDKALANIETLFDIALHPEKEDGDKCKKLSRAVAKTSQKGNPQKIIYGHPEGEGEAPTNGIIIPGTSQYFKKAFDLIDQAHQCTGAIQRISIESLTPAGIHAKKGTLHEQLTGLMVNLFNAVNEEDENKRNNLLKEVVDILGRAKEVTDYLVAETNNGETITDFEENASLNLGLEENELFQDQAELKKFVHDYYVSMLPFIQAAQADTLVHAGKQNRTGGREDGYFVYKSKDKADKASKRFGVENNTIKAADFIAESEDPAKTTQQLSEVGIGAEDTMHTLGLGQKIYSKFKATGIGEINSVARLTQIALGRVPLDDPYFDKDFVKKLDKEFPLTDVTKKSFEDLQARSENIFNLITKKPRLVSQSTNSTIPTQEQGQMVIDQLTKELPYLGELKSELGSIITDYKDTDSDRQILAEHLQRYTMVKQIKELNKSNPKEARNFLLRIAFICGGNSREMVQSVLSQKGRKQMSFSHNAIFTQLKKASKININFSPKGFAIGLDAGNNLEGKISLDPTASSSKLAWNTRTTFSVSKKTQDALNALEKTVNDDIMYQYLKGQQQLLETLLNQTTLNPST